MKKEEWRNNIKSLMRERDEVLRKQQMLKCQLNIGKDLNTGNCIVNEMHSVYKDLNHCNFMLDRLISNDILESME